jgi:hypothetical protein
MRAFRSVHSTGSPAISLIAVIPADLLPDCSIALLRALADVLEPGGEIVLGTYGSHLPADAPAIEVHEPGDVYARDDFVYWGFAPEGLRRLARIVGLDEVEIVDQLEIGGHPRILAVLRAAA